VKGTRVNLSETKLMVGGERHSTKMKKCSEMHAGCSKVEPKIFTPLQTPFPGVQDSQNLISWRWSLPLPTNPVW